MTIVVKTPDGGTATFPDGMAPDAIERVLKEQFSKPQVPIASGAPQPVRREPETGPMSYVHKGLDFLRGTGEGVAGIPDVAEIGTTALRNLGKHYRGEPEDPYRTPVTDFYNEHMPEPYDADTNETGASLGPAALEALLTRGRSLFQPGPGFLRNLVKESALTASRATITNEMGKYGSEAGGFVGEKLGGEAGGVIGNLAGGAATPSVGSGGKKLGARGLVDKESKEILAAAERTNKRFNPPTRPGQTRGPAGQDPVPVSLGLVGSKGAGIAEDITARGILTGGPAQRARAEQYRGIEGSVQNAAERLRGGPSTGPISKETIGTGVQEMSRKADNVLSRRISTIQDQLEQGAGEHVDPSAFRHEMNGIINDRGVDTRLRMQAQGLLDRFNSNADLPASGIGPERPPTYSATRQLRAGLGKEIPAEGGLDTFVQDPAYTSLTQTMRSAAADPVNFDQVQEETARLANHRRGLRRPSRAPNEGSAYNAVFGGEGKNSLQQLEGFREATPDDLATLMADNLELRTRGATNAGRAPEPETFDPKLLQQWHMMSPEARSAYSGGNPDIEAQLDDAARLARADVVRPGKRSSPGSTGSTIGASMQLGVPGGFGALLGQGTGTGIGGIAAGAVGIPALMAAGNYGIGRAMTSPSVVRSTVNPAPIMSVPHLTRTAVTTGRGGEIAMGDQEAAAQQEADRAELERIIANGGVP